MNLLLFERYFNNKIHLNERQIYINNLKFKKCNEQTMKNLIKQIYRNSNYYFLISKKK